MNNLMKKRVLVIEDELHLAEGLSLNLNLQGHDVSVAENGRIGLEKWKSFNPDLIILDIMMPELDGHAVLTEIRKIDAKLPILILSAKNESRDKVRALKKGVDDYLGKPFDLEELLLRVERLLERSSWPLKEDDSTFKDIFRFGKNEIDFVHNKASTAGGVRNLTLQELKILRLFFENPGRPLSREELLKVGWEYNAETTTRTVDNFMVRFRKYFEPNPKEPIYFKSIRSVGYLFEKQD